MRKIMLNSFALTLLVSAFLLSATLVTGSNLKMQHMLSDVLQEVLEKLKSFYESTPEDKVYVHCDKPFYKPGETAWFAVYIRNGKDLKPSTQSDILHVEIINPKGAVEKTLKIIAKNGVAQGDYLFPAGSAGGMYKIRAFSEWMKNDSEPAIFEKEIQVQSVILPRLKMKLDFQKDGYGPGAVVNTDLSLHTNENKPLANYAFEYVVSLEGKEIKKEKSTTNPEGTAMIQFSLPANLATHDGLLNVMIQYQGQTEAISRAVPIVLNNISMNFFPEGGDLVANLPSKIGFNALNEFGKPTDVAGYISDATGKTVAKFESFHKGMGAFDFTPLDGGQYTAHITQPENVEKTFTLPESMPQGYVLTMQRTTKDHLFLNIHSTQEEALSLVTTVHGHSYFSATIKAHKGLNELSIPTKEMPMGIAQITLFDSKGVARAERLSFVNSHKSLKVELSTDKEKYLPREKVNLTVKVSDERGMPMPAQLSLAVVNDQLLTFADDKSSNILSWLLVEGELKGKVDEPNFYFDEKENPEKRATALNYLLMTAGWRRYTWKEILSDQPMVMKYPAQRAEIAGKVLDSQGKPAKNATVSISGTEFQTKTDAEGEYSLKGYPLNQPIYVHVIGEDKQSQTQFYVGNYGNQYNVSLYNYNIIPPTTVPTTATISASKPLLAPKGGKHRAEVASKMEAAPEPPQAVAEVDFNDFGGADDVTNEELQEGLAFDAVEAPKKENQKEEKAANKKEDIQGDIAQAAIADARMQDWGDMEDKIIAQPAIMQAQYYLAKEFSSPVYNQNQAPENTAKRTDFRTTLYWNGNVTTDRTGKTQLSFYTSDEITSFRITAEGIATDGMVGRGEKTFFSQLPFGLSAKMPLEVVTEDVVKIPLTFMNNTAQELTGNLLVEVPEGMVAADNIPEQVSIPALQAKTLYLKYNVVNTQGAGKLAATFTGKGFSDAFEQEIKVVSKGFPVKLSASGSKMEQSFSFETSNIIQGTQNITFTAFPSTVNELMKGLEGMLGEPYGCFEQTSSSTYPNILVLQYLQVSGQSKPEIVKRAKDLIQRGYDRLVAYESKSGGFEWFGGDPAHEGLTAYGLMEFMDMAKVWDGVDNKMVTRTANWLMQRRDGEGLFQRNPRALHEFGLTDNETMSAYIVWALSEFQQKDMEKELEKTYQNALRSRNPYQLGLLANAMINYGRKKEGANALAKLIEIQNKDGAWTHNSEHRSAPGSQGQGLAIESAALALLAMTKSDQPNIENIRKVAEFLQASRQGSGVFGNTNSTVLALRALIAYTQFSKRTDESGNIEILVDGKKVAEESYAKGQQNAIVIDELQKFAPEGKHDFTVRFTDTKTALPYSLSVNYHTFLPPSHKECAVKLEATLAKTLAKVGETVRLSAKLTNTKSEGQAMTMAIIGLPAGLAAQPWQLKEMKEKGVFDFYETIGNNVVLYYRQMKPSEVRSIDLDLKAELAGTYDAPASCGYLYYTNEYRNWAALPKITITQ